MQQYVLLESFLLRVLVAILCAAAVSFAVTPIVRVLAFKIGAVDVPKDNRRMHKKPMPLLGGLSIFLGVTVAGAAFCEITPALIAAWFGALIIIVLGILDDIYDLNPFVKLGGQILAACIVVIVGGVRIEHINLFGKYIHFEELAIPITIFWIIGMTNAINLIDGLDGLACGVSAICSTSLLIVTLLHADFTVAMLTATLAGACLGFLPFNANPAKIFMGDTGALFLGYMLSVISVIGVFKTEAVLSFMIPIIIFGYPLFDTAFSFIRRILQHRSPFSADRGHLHHRIIDMGFNVKQSVSILYLICSFLGIFAVMLSEQRVIAALLVLAVSILIGLVNYLFVTNRNTRPLTGMDDREEPQTPSSSEKPEEKSTPPSDSEHHANT